MNTEPRLLVVDDEEVVCKSCSRIFESKGFQVDTSTNSVEGLKKAQGGKYDAILLDIKMPTMDGLEFLEKLRADDNDVPVIMITGYSSVPTAAHAMRLGAVDYIPKPFTPQEIGDAVARLTRSAATTITAPAAAPARAVPATTAGAPWASMSDDVHFFDEAWVQVGQDGTVRAGIHISRELGAKIEQVKLVELGQSLVQGLPLAQVRTADGQVHTIPSPVTGEVVELNPKATAKLSLTWEDPCREGWLVRVRPSRLAGDLKTTRQRDLALVNLDETKAREQSNALAYLGAKVHAALDLQAVVAAVRDRGVGVALVDAGSLAEAGPALVGRLNSAVPDLKVVVLASQSAKWEKSYRQHKILYYAVEPFADNEIAEILHTAFRPAVQAAPARQVAVGLPSWVRRVRLTNRRGEVVSLIASGGMMLESAGVGRAIIDRVLAGAFPVRVTLGRDGLTPMDIRREAKDADRVLVLVAEDSSRIPGSLARNAPSELVAAAGEDAKNVMAIAVQPAGRGGALEFDDRTTVALAEAIVEEMVAP